MDTRASSHKHSQSHHDEHKAKRSEYSVRSEKNAYAADGYPRKTHRPDAGKAAEYSQKKPGAVSYESRYVQPKKKKKKFKIKRFFKKLGKELQAFGAKLIEVEEVPLNQANETRAFATADLGFSQKKPLFSQNSAVDRGPKQKAQPLTAKGILHKTQKALLKALRFVARGIYLGVRNVYQFLMKLPQRTLLIGSGAFGVLLITVVVLAIALPGKATKAEEETIAAFTALETEQTALESATLDGTQSGETTADGTQTGDTTQDAVTEQPADTTVADTTSAVTFTEEVKSGDNGEIISTIQTRLMELGYMDSDEPTQHFGPLTQSAL